jgi:hypothetical protein
MYKILVRRIRSISSILRATSKNSINRIKRKFANKWSGSSHPEDSWLRACLNWIKIDLRDVSPKINLFLIPS